MARLTRKQIAEIYDVRAMLESAVIRIFTEKASEAEIAHLRALYENLYTTRHTGNVAAIPRAARWCVQWPGPQPASSTGPSSPSAQRSTRSLSQSSAASMEPNRSMYSAERPE